MTTGYWPSPWPAEDAGPRRWQQVAGRLGAATLDVRSRDALAATMVVLRDPGEVYLLRHTAGDAAISWVERIDPDTLECLERSPDLAGGPTWPGSLACHANGDLHVVFGNHAHRLAADCSLVASTTLPRHRPYNGFVVLDDGTLVTKDFGGSRPGHHVAAADRQPAELVALHPDTLEVLDRAVVAEPSIARLSSDGSSIVVVGDTSVLLVGWDGGRFVLRSDPRATYRTLDGQTYGWDAVLALDAAWFLDDGEGSECYTGTLRGHGVSTAPLHLVRADLASGEVRMTEVSGLPGGLIANPPLVDPDRGLVLAYDSGNGVIACFDAETLEPRWRRDQDHGSHLVLFAQSGEVVTGDHDPAAGEHVVVLDLTTGEELARAATDSPVQSVVFPAADPATSTMYLTSFTTVTRVRPG